MDERRQTLRREEDEEKDEIAHTVEHTLPFIKRMRSQVPTLVIGALVGSLIAFPSAVLGARIVGPKQDLEAARAEIAANKVHLATVDTAIASLRATLSDMKRDINIATRLGCLNSPVPVAKAAGCNE